MLVGVVYLARGGLAGDSKTGRIGLRLRHRRSGAAVRVRMGAAAVRRSAHVEHRADDRRRRIRPGHAAARRRHDRGRRRNPAPAELGLMAPVRTADLRPAVAGRDPDPVHIACCGSGSPSSALATWCWAWRRSATASAAPTTRSRLRRNASRQTLLREAVLKYGMIQRSQAAGAPAPDRCRINPVGERIDVAGSQPGGEVRRATLGSGRPGSRKRPKYDAFSSRLPGSHRSRHRESAGR